jgi:hypothetical protein
MQTIFHKFPRRNSFHGALVVIAAAAAMSLAGCASAAPSSLPSTKGASSTPAFATPSTTPAPLAKIEFGHDALALIGADGQIIETIPYASNPKTVVPELAQHIGAEPKLVQYSHGVCGGPGQTTTASWGGGLTLTYDPAPAVGDAPAFTVYSQAATIASGARIETPYGFAVGDSIKKLIAGTPRKLVQGPTSVSAQIRVFYDLDSKKHGGQADAVKGQLVTDLYAPGIVGEDC